MCSWQKQHLAGYTLKPWTYIHAGHLSARDFLRHNHDTGIKLNDRRSQMIRLCIFNKLQNHRY